MIPPAGMPMSTNALLAILADGGFHSGSDLGRRLGVSRTAIWKQVRNLIADGIDVQSVQGKGYRVQGGLDLLDPDVIARQVAAIAGSPRLAGLDVFETVDSTNEVALSRARAGGAHRHAFLAERQLAGRGRRGRTWVSPFAANIYLSLVWEFSGGIAAIDGLSLVVGLSVCESLERLGLRQPGLKWPNDIVHRGAKLGGVLVELSGDLAGTCQAVIGIGLNVRMPVATAAQIDQSWTDLGQAGLAVPRSVVAGAMIGAMLSDIPVFEQQGLQVFLDRWRDRDTLRGEPVLVTVGEQLTEGVAEGIADDGSFLLRTGGTVRRFKGGEVTLRRKQ